MFILLRFLGCSSEEKEIKPNYISIYLQYM